MKKYILGAMMAMASVFGLSAQDSSGYNLLVNTANGNVVKYAFEYCPTATFDGDEIVIIDEDHAEGMRYNMADIVNLTIGKPGTGIDKVMAANLSIAVTKTALAVEGLAEGGVVSIYSVSGAQVAKGVAGADGKVVIAIDGLGSGVFVASMPGNSFKFIR